MLEKSIASREMDAIMEVKAVEELKNEKINIDSLFMVQNEK